MVQLTSLRRNTNRPKTISKVYQPSALSNVANSQGNTETPSESNVGSSCLVCRPSEPNTLHQGFLPPLLSLSGTNLVYPELSAEEHQSVSEPTTNADLVYIQPVLPRRPGLKDPESGDSDHWQRASDLQECNPHV